MVFEVAMACIKTTVKGVKLGYNKILRSSSAYILAVTRNHIPIHVFSLLWHGSVLELSKATKMIFESEACGFVAPRTDLSGGTRRRLSAVDDRQHRIANEIS